MSDRLQEIKQRAEAATPGPWKAVEYLYGIETSDGNMLAHGLNGAKPSEVQPNQDFIAHAREDIPWLIERVDRLRKTLIDILDLCDEDDGLDQLLIQIIKYELKGD